jgi:hypothetical protein
MRRLLLKVLGFGLNVWAGVSAAYHIMAAMQAHGGQQIWHVAWAGFLLATIHVPWPWEGKR